jgi:citrate lyase subunit beta/citryl-CoA lyase
MTSPQQALFEGEKPFPIIPSCEHFAGSEKLITKAFELQAKNPVFDITLDLEDGAPTGREKEHAELYVRLLKSDGNAKKMAGVRVHDYTNGHWRQDVDLVVGGYADVLSIVNIT